jgi:hypothetical protein
MSQEPKPLDVPEESSLGFGKILLVLLLFLFAIFILAALGPNAWILDVLLFGWLKFLSRTVPRISWNWDLVGMAGLCLGVSLVLTHGFLRWLATQIANSRGKVWAWPWRWTWCGTLSMGVLFLVGMAVGGIVHQTGWIAASPEPLYETKGRLSHAFELKQFQLELMMAINDSNADLDETRIELASSLARQRYLKGRAAEYITCLVIVDTSRRIVGGILFHRVRSGPETSRDILYWNSSTQDWVANTELPALIQKHRGQLMAL